MANRRRHQKSMFLFKELPTSGIAELIDQKPLRDDTYRIKIASSGD